MQCINSRNVSPAAADVRGRSLERSGAIGRGNKKTTIRMVLGNRKNIICIFPLYIVSLFRLSRFTGNADSILGVWNWSCGGRCRLVHRGSVDDAIQPFPLRKSLIYWILTIIQLFANVILWLLTCRHPWSATQSALRVLDGVGLISPLLKLVFPLSLSLCSSYTKLFKNFIVIGKYLTIVESNTSGYFFI